MIVPSQRFVTLELNSSACSLESTISFLSQTIPAFSAKSIFPGIQTVCQSFAAEKSVFKFYKKLIALRKSPEFEEILVEGNTRPVYTEEEYDVLGSRRMFVGESSALDFIGKKVGDIFVTTYNHQPAVAKITSLGDAPRFVITADVNRVVNVIGGYYMQMGGCDAIAFTAGLGENDCNLRHMICEALEKGLGLEMNYEVNDCTRGKEAKISAEGSKVEAWIVPTNEELAICRETVALV